MHERHMLYHRLMLAAGPSRRIMLPSLGSDKRISEAFS